MAKVLIDPITRIEGHLSIEMEVKNGKVVDAKSIGDMYRGFENILRGRNPVDANQITQRICGVCPVSHGLASSKCLDDAFGIVPNKNGRILRNLILAANYMQSHILHFYHLAALDYVDITSILKYNGSNSKLVNLKSWAKNELAVKKDRVDQITSVGPFLPRYEGKDFYIKDLDTNISAITGYVQALDIRIKAHQMAALFGGRMPHAIGLVPGGVTQVPTKDKIKQYRKLLKEVEKFVNSTFLPHVLAVAGAFPDYFKIGGYDKFLSYGAFDELDNDKGFVFKQGTSYGTKLEGFDSKYITEQVKYSRFSSASNLHPFKGQTDANPKKPGAYTWLKAPRYNGEAMEVGPLARTVVSYLSGDKMIKPEVDGVLKHFNAEIGSVFSVLGRYASRAIECKVLCQKAYAWLDELEVGKAPRSTYKIPKNSEGMGLTEAPRGALGHWIVVKDQKIDNYQCVVPTTWYNGPRDDKGKRGPVEQALIGTPIADAKNPIEAARVVRSFDPCLACAVHVVENGEEVAAYRVT